MNEPEKSKLKVEYIAKMLQNRKTVGEPPTVLFLGSRTGSLFCRPFLADLLEQFSYLDFSNMTLVERFHECYHLLEDFKKQKQDSDIHAIISHALAKKRVEVADLCVAELMKEQIFDYIITTNIGNELERAFLQSDMKQSRDFEVIIPGAGKMTKGRGFRMVKASGDVVAEKYNICGYHIQSEEIYLDKYPELITSLEQVNKEAMLMIGFDNKWDEHILHIIFPHIKGSLWYISEEQTAEDSPLFSYLDTYQARRLEDPTGAYEPFLTNLCFHTLGFIPSAPTDQTSKDKLRHMQHNILSEVSNLTESVNKLLESQQDMMMNLKILNQKVDTLLMRSTLDRFSDPLSQEGKEGSLRNAKLLEENCK